MIRISAGAVVALLASSGLAWAQQPGFEPAYGSAEAMRTRAGWAAVAWEWWLTIPTSSSTTRRVRRR